MSISRIDKFVRETGKHKGLTTARAARNVDIDIFLADDDSGKVAQMALIANALALRCFTGEVRFHFPKSQRKQMHHRGSAIIELMREEAHKFGAAERFKIANGSAGRARLALGMTMDGAVIADASGWTAAVNQVLPASPCLFVPATTLAVCGAMAKVFACHVLGDPTFVQEKWSRSLATFTSSCDTSLPTPVNLGTIFLLGAGAIGTAFMYCLWLSDWTANVCIIDSDTYQDPNHETSLFIGLRETRENPHKAVALCRLAARQGLTLRPEVCRIKQNDPLLQHATDAFVCAVDNPETRCELDAVNSALLVNAGVGGRAEDAGHVLWSRHQKCDKPLSHYYKGIDPLQLLEEQASIEFEDECSRLAYRDASLAAPFLGTAAGALLLASCTARATATLTDANYFKMDLLKLQGSCRVERVTG